MDHFKNQFEKLQDEKMLRIEADGVRLTRQGLLQVDRLLPGFYASSYRNVRYT